MGGSLLELSVFLFTFNLNFGHSLFSSYAEDIDLCSFICCGCHCFFDREDMLEDSDLCRYSYRDYLEFLPNVYSKSV